jgi:hypothetical protein
MTDLTTDLLLGGEGVVVKGQPLEHACVIEWHVSFGRQ